MIQKIAGDVIIDTGARSVLLPDTRGWKRLSRREWELLLQLAVQPRTYKRPRNLVHYLWGRLPRKEAAPAKLRRIVARLRAKLGSQRIESERDLGYRIKEVA